MTWGYEHSLVTMANLILPEDQKLPELFGYFYGKCYIESTWLWDPYNIILLVSLKNAFRKE